MFQILQTGSVRIMIGISRVRFVGGLLWCGDIISVVLNWFIKGLAVYKYVHDKVHLKDPLASLSKRERDLSPGSVFLSVIDMSITEMKGGSERRR